LNIGRLLLPIILASCSSYAQAVLIEGRDWLQLSETTGFTWDEIDAIFDSSTGACDAASCTLSSTVDLAGYRWASNEEVDAMMSSFFAVSGLTHLAGQEDDRFTSEAAMNDFFALMTPTREDDWDRRVEGWTRDRTLNETNADSIYAYQHVFGPSPRLSVYGLIVQSPRTSSWDRMGGWFYRLPETTVPLDSSRTFLIIGLLCLLYSKRPLMAQTGHSRLPELD